MDQNIHDKLVQYLETNKALIEVRKQAKELKKKSDTIEKEVKEYMSSNNMDSISLPSGEIIMYEKKINQTFKKTAMVEKLRDELRGDEKKAEALVESILSNKSYTIQTCLKAKPKKN